jgi:2-polyprenyl-3-methyl-5-hydroxy-6-metoxy-1,4-benzoquinol methylase
MNGSAFRNTIARCLPLLIFATCLLAQVPTIEQQKERWNKVFTGSVIPFNHQPNAFLLKSVQGKTPGTALEIGMGQGRNTIAMASLGWDVTGIDISDEGIRQALAEAKKQNVTIHAISASADDFDYGTARYNLIYATFEHQIVSDNAAKIVAALKPDGMVVIEGFQEDVSKQVGFQLGHKVNELPRAFDQLRIVYYEDTVGPADWNDGKPAPIVRFIARKQQK